MDNLNYNNIEVSSYMGCSKKILVGLLLESEKNFKIEEKTNEYLGSILDLMSPLPVDLHDSFSELKSRYETECQQIKDEFNESFLTQKAANGNY